MSETGGVILKAFETNTGKYVSDKFFGRLEKALSSKAIEREARGVLDTISPIHESEKEAIFEKVTDKYLKFRTLLSRDKDVYINQIYHPLKLRLLSTSHQEHFTLDEKTLLELPKVACIIGKAGQGKTTILRKVFENYLLSDSHKFPLIITLRKVDWSSEDISVPKVVSQEFKELGIEVSEDVCSYLLQLNRLQILYDGFDEVELDNRKSALNLIMSTHTTFGTNCIVTTRPGTDVTYYGGAIVNYELLDLSLSDVETIITKHTLIKDIDKSQLMSVIRGKSDIASILLTPIIVDIFISTYHMLVEEPEHVVDVYEQLFLALSSTHDKLKVSFKRKSKSGLNNSELQKVFQTASYKLLCSKSDITFKNVKIIEAFDFASEKLGFTAKNTLEDVVDKTSLIKEEGDDYSYLHKSIIEFFSAKHIQELSDETRTQFYKYLLVNYDSKYENVLRYLRVIDDELFFIVFIKELIVLLREVAGNIFNATGYELNDDVLNMCLLSDEFEVKVHKSGGIDIRILPDNTVSHKRKVFRDILASVLDVNTNLFSESDILELGISTFRNEEKLLSDDNLFATVIDTTKKGETKVYHVKIMELMQFNSELFNELIDSNGLVRLYEDIKLLNDLAEQKKKVYESKNALTQFYS